MEASGDKKPENLEIHSIKSTQFRVIHADGVFGGVSPKGYIHCGFFSERFPIPRHSSIAIAPTGAQAAPEQILEGKSGVVREYEANVIMDFNTAASFHSWLGGKLEELGRNLQVSESDMKRLLGGGK